MIVHEFRSAAGAVAIGRGYIPVYYADTIDHCLACGHSQWLVGRSMAECAICETAMPLANPAARIGVQAYSPVGKPRRFSSALTSGSRPRNAR